MSGSALAAAEAAQEAARRQRSSDREHQARRERRKAMRLLGPAAHEHERLPYPCAVACLDCGFFEVPVASGDPMRSDSTALALPQHGCPGCGRRSWVDLASVADAALLRDLEQREIELRAGIPLAALALSASLALLGFAAVELFAHGAWLPQFAMVAIAGLIAMVTGRRLIAGLSTPRRRACRWRAPARESSPGAVIGHGCVRGDRTLRAPITGREVLAWRVEVRYPGDRGPAFALIEQRCVSISVDEVVLLEDPILATTAVAVTADDEPAQRYLRSRGIDPNALLEIHECVLLANDRVQVRGDAAAARAVLLDAPRT